MHRLADEIVSALKSKPMHLYQIRERFPNAGLPPWKRDSKDDHALFLLCLRLAAQTDSDLVSRVLSMQPKDRWTLEIMVISYLQADGDLSLEDSSDEDWAVPDSVRQKLFQAIKGKDDSSQ